MSFYDSIKLIVNAILVLIILVVVIWFMKELRFMKLHNRLTKYTIIQNREHRSLFDIIKDYFVNFRKMVSNILSKSAYFRNYSQKYEKYIDKNKDEMTNPMEYVATKFILSLGVLVILLVSQVIQNEKITISQIIIAFTLGYFSFDFFLLSKRKMYEYRIKNDLLKAITIMNNSFKSGKSIMETIKIVSEEIDGPLKEEFLKMHQDLEYGLEIEEVFKRFNARVNLPEVKYITTSLTILNKTGGNIVDVFASIEKTVFNNKKLEDELRNLSASSRALYHLLTLIPLILTLIIYLLDVTYFMPLFTSPLGLAIIVLIIVLYVSYIILVKKIIKIKEY